MPGNVIVFPLWYMFSAEQCYLSISYLYNTVYKPRIKLHSVIIYIIHVAARNNALKAFHNFDVIEYIYYAMPRNYIAVLPQY